MTKTVIVTGGCGYIGSHVARAFKMNGDTVHIIDRVQREHTLKDIDGYFIDDFATDESLATIIDLQPDVIVHCAGTSLVGPSIDNPSEYYDNNITKTLRLLDVISTMPKKPVIMFSSSASVYGNPTRLPISEMDPKGPISPYGNTKYMTELILRDYCRAYKINSVCFRYFNAAGAEPINHDLGQEPGATHIVARVLEASLAGRAFTINGDDYNTPDGTCVRDYVHVWDIATAHIKGADFINSVTSDSEHAIAMLFNLGTCKGISNKQIVDYVAGRYGLVHVNYGPRRGGDPDELVADPHSAQDLLSWEPQFSDLETIVDSAYKWYSSGIR
jgi:UDP-glucose-4-epimerase GalE